MHAPESSGPGQRSTLQFHQRPCGCADRPERSESETLVDFRYREVRSGLHSGERLDDEPQEKARQHPSAVPASLSSGYGAAEGIREAKQGSHPDRSSRTSRVRHPGGLGGISSRRRWAFSRNWSSTSWMSSIAAGLEPWEEDPLEVAFSVVHANYEEIDQALEARITEWLAQNRNTGRSFGCWSSIPGKSSPGSGGMMLRGGSGVSGRTPRSRTSSKTPMGGSGSSTAIDQAVPQQEDRDSTGYPGRLGVSTIA